jgi:hypothetical protein
VKQSEYPDLSALVLVDAGQPCGQLLDVSTDATQAKARVEGGQVDEDGLHACFVIVPQRFAGLVQIARNRTPPVSEGVIRRIEPCTRQEDLPQGRWRYREGTALACSGWTLEMGTSTGAMRWRRE